MSDVPLTQFQSLVTGAVWGALMKASTGAFLIDVELETDDDGNYGNKILVTGKQSGEELLVSIDVFDAPEFDTPETVAEKAQRARAIQDRFNEIMGDA